MYRKFVFIVTLENCVDFVNNRICFAKVQITKLIKLKLVLPRRASARVSQARRHRFESESSLIKTQNKKSSLEQRSIMQKKLKCRNEPRFSNTTGNLPDIHLWKDFRNFLGEGPDFNLTKFASRIKVLHFIFLHHTVGMKNINRRLLQIFVVHLTVQRFFSFFFRRRRLTQVCRRLLSSRPLRSPPNPRWPWLVDLGAAGSSRRVAGPAWNAFPVKQDQQQQLVKLIEIVPT